MIVATEIVLKTFDYAELARRPLEADQRALIGFQRTACEFGVVGSLWGNLGCNDHRSTMSGWNLPRFYRPDLSGGPKFCEILPIGRFRQRIGGIKRLRRRGMAASCEDIHLNPWPRPTKSRL